MTYWLYIPNFIEKEKCKIYYDELLKLVDKEHKTIMVYGKEYVEPRLTGIYSKREGHNFHYSGTDHISNGWPSIIDELSNKCKERLSKAEKISPNVYNFDSALVNYYQSGETPIGRHRDKDSYNTIVASLSFGATRKFIIRDNNTKIVDTVFLEEGSLFLMFPGMQQNYTHEIPKQLKVKEGRINLTLRQHL